MLLYVTTHLEVTLINRSKIIDAGKRVFNSRSACSYSVKKLLLLSSYFPKC
jgi:hypothetical protein